MRVKNFWDVLSWVCFAYLVLYGFLKVFGILHSPPVADAMAIASVAFYAGRLVSKVDLIDREVLGIKQQLSEHHKHLSRHDLQFAKVLSKLDQHSKKLDEHSVILDMHSKLHDNHAEKFSQILAKLN